jgi:hypothetical protein
MLVLRRTSVLSLVICCLLVSWLCYGYLEFLEQVNVIPETAAEDQSDQDLDEAALFQLASGLKSDVLSLDTPCGTSSLEERSEPAGWLSVHTVHPLDPVIVQSRPSLRLHQKNSIYRIWASFHLVAERHGCADLNGRSVAVRIILISQPVYGRRVWDPFQFVYAWFRS